MVFDFSFLLVALALATGLVVLADRRWLAPARAAWALLAGLTVVLVAAGLPGCDPVHKVSIIPRGPALGYPLQLPLASQSLDLIVLPHALESHLDAHHGRPLPVPAQQAVDGAAEALGRRHLAGELERMNRLKRYLSPQIAETVLGADDTLFKSHRREITVVFLDLRGFTAFTDTAEPEEVMAVLAEFHAAMGALITEYEGTVPHFAGEMLKELQREEPRGRRRPGRMMAGLGKFAPCIRPAAPIVGEILADRSGSRVEEIGFQQAPLLHYCCR